MSYAPVVVFAYKRKDKLELCLSALEKNRDADRTDLYIFVDGAKGSTDEPQVEEVRNFVREYTKKSIFKSVKVIVREKNVGLANSIISGVTEVITEHHKAIIVEDDLITAEDFILYMNDALNYYEPYQEYGSISAYSYPLKELKKYNKDIFVTGKGECWGWGTWQNRWEKVDWEVKSYEEYIHNTKMRKQFENLETGLDDMLIAQMQGEIDSWAVRWCYHLFRSQLLTVYPRVSRVINIGMDGSGTHCSSIAQINSDINHTVAHCKFERMPINKKMEKKSAKFIVGPLYKRLLRRIWYKMHEFKVWIREHI